jgi:hypothetical protein
MAESTTAANPQFLLDRALIAISRQPDPPSAPDPHPTCRTKRKDLRNEGEK